MTPKELVDWLTKVPDCTGNVTIGRDEMYGLSLGEAIKGALMHQEHGYVARTNIKNASYSGRGLSIEEAVKALGDKLKSKFQTL